MARAIRPALAGGLIAVAGVGAAFLANVASFFGVIVVVARWKRPIRTRTTPAKTLEGATIAAIRYIRNVPVTRAVNAARRRCDVLRERSACPPANRCTRNQPTCDRLRDPAWLVEYRIDPEDAQACRRRCSSTDV